MNKWVERTIWINIIFLILYVVADYATWSVIPATGTIGNIGYAIGLEQLRVTTIYALFTRYVRIVGIQNTPQVFQGVSYSSYAPNLPFVIFLMALVANALLMSKSHS